MGAGTDARWQAPRGSAPGRGRAVGARDLLQLQTERASPREALVAAAKQQVDDFCEALLEQGLHWLDRGVALAAWLLLASTILSMAERLIHLLRTDPEEH